MLAMVTHLHDPALLLLAKSVQGCLSSLQPQQCRTNSNEARKCETQFMLLSCACVQSLFSLRLYNNTILVFVLWEHSNVVKRDLQRRGWVEQVGILWTTPSAPRR